MLEVAFDDGSRFELPFEYLRVYSPSAEVRGHGPGQETLQLGKHEVGIRAVEPVGNYAVRLVFDDGHDTGLYTWDYLHELGTDARREVVSSTSSGSRSSGCPTRRRCRRSDGRRRSVIRRPGFGGVGSPGTP